MYQQLKTSATIPQSHATVAELFFLPETRQRALCGFLGLPGHKLTLCFLLFFRENEASKFLFNILSAPPGLTHSPIVIRKICLEEN